MDDIFEVQCYRHVIDSAEILEMSWIEVIVNVRTELLTYWNSQVNIDITTELLTKRTVVIHALDTSQLHLISSSVILDYASLGLSCSPFIQS
jgi:hypothetical protein